MQPVSVSADIGACASNGHGLAGLYLEAGMIQGGPRRMSDL